MPTLKLTLDTRRVRKDGSFPIVFRITNFGEVRNISTGYYAKINQWNDKTRCLKKNHPSFDLITPRLKELEAELQLKLIELERKTAGNLKVQVLKKHLIKDRQVILTVSGFWDKEINHLKKVGRAGGARVYSQAYSVLSKKRDFNIPFEEVNIEFLKNLEADLIEDGLCINAIGVYFRTLRAIYNKAVDSDYAEFKYYPFRRFKIRKEPTIPRPLTIEELLKYFNLQISRDSTYYESWLMGKLMFMLIGINFTDLILMKEGQIKHVRLVYTRSKTKKQYSVKLLPEALKIIDYFKEKGAETILGKIALSKIEDKERLPYIIHQANKVFNYHLDCIGKLIESKEKLTGYCFRYTTANIAKQLGYSKDLISEALGHSYGSRVTGAYLEAYDLALIDKMNEHVCAIILSGVIPKTNGKVVIS